MTYANHITAIAYRDLVKFLRDPARLLSSLIFPVLFVGIMGGSMDANLGDQAGYSLLTFVFTGIYAQSLFQSTSLGVIWLIEDRENDFSQEIFVSPTSRYSIILGKIVGETLVAMTQGITILLFGFVIGISFTATQLAGLIVVGLLSCFLGGAFGVAMLANLGNTRSANQIFPFIMFPQFFLAGVFTPIKILPWYLEIPSRFTPMRYAVDLTRVVYYRGTPDASHVVLDSGWLNLAVIVAMFAVFLISGTYFFVRSERNR